MQEGARGPDGWRRHLLRQRALRCALVDEPLEVVVGSRVDRFVNPLDREDFESLLRAGSVAGGAGWLARVPAPSR